jgi:2-oxoglutarate ferredoxin oxidoreductase subunit alpha
LGFNLNAARLGAEAADAWELGDRFYLTVGQPASRLWLSGADAIALGAVAAGVSFYAGYPMSPATNIMTSLATWGAEAGVHVEQAEDEVAAINMVAGAAYAGARAMTATSGGGYCLMTEGVSLMGMIEVPAVVALCQRPGPATGLPTRTAQGDLNLARYGGHGFFPRILLAPKNIPDAFEVAALAFDLAEKYQAPVHIITDQHINDSQATCETPQTAHLPTDRYYLTPEQLAGIPEYRRYAWSDDGLSPMAMPGKSKHLVYADSDEHDELGHITESAEVSDRMVKKRMAKLATIEGAAWGHEVEGELDGRALVVSWGSTYETVREALGLLAEEGRPVAHVHLRWLWPLAPSLKDVLSRAGRVAVVEASVAGELAGVLQERTLTRVDASITKRDGRPFSVAELQERIGQEVAA